MKLGLRKPRVWLKLQATAALAGVSLDALIGMDAVDVKRRIAARIGVT